MSLYYPSIGPLPYESMFSIFIKLSHANFMEFPRLSKVVNNLNLNPGVMHNWYQIRQSAELEVLVPEFDNHLPFGFAPPKGLRKMRLEFAFCPHCIRFGYHSVFNVIRSHDFCVLHKCRLSVACSACNENYFYGFRFREPMQKLLAPCDQCGFEDVGLFKEIQMRRSGHLNKALRSVGEKQAAWYTKIKELNEQYSSFDTGYYTSLVARKDYTVPFERAAKMESPERCAQFLTDTQRVSWVQHPRRSPKPHFTDSAFIIGDPLKSGFEAIKQRYLTKHCECLKFANELTDFPDGYYKNGIFCPMAIAYILLRIKVAYGEWPAAENVSPLDAALRTGSSTFRKVNTHRVLRIMFLGILGRIQYKVSQGANFVMLCRRGGEFSAGFESFIYIRRSSYSFRNMCGSLSASPKVSRKEFGGPIVVSFPNNDIEPYGLPKEQMIV